MVVVDVDDSALAQGVWVAKTGATSFWNSKAPGTGFGLTKIAASMRPDSEPHGTLSDLRASVMITATNRLHKRAMAGPHLQRSAPLIFV